MPRSAESLAHVFIRRGNFWHLRLCALRAYRCVVQLAQHALRVYHVRNTVTVTVITVTVTVYIGDISAAKFSCLRFQV